MVTPEQLDSLYLQNLTTLTEIHFSMSHFQVGEDSIVERKEYSLWFYIFKKHRNKCKLNYTIKVYPNDELNLEIMNQRSEWRC